MKHRIRLYRRFGSWHMDILTPGFEEWREMDTGIQAFYRAASVRKTFAQAEWADAELIFDTKDDF